MPHWNWKGMEGKNVPVFVYTNGDCAELFINGKSQGKKCKKPTSTKSTERFRLMWKNVTYEPGEVKAVAYKAGKKIGEKVMRTAGAPYRLKLTADRSKIKADGLDLSYILVEAYDKKGNRCPLANNKITINIEGKAHIAGTGNGNPQSFEPFQDNEVNLFYGKAMIIIGSDFEKGTVTVNAKAVGLKNDTAEIYID